MEVRSGRGRRRVRRLAGWSHPFGCLSLFVIAGSVVLFVIAGSVVHMYLCSGLTRELTFIFDPVLA